MPLSNPSDNSVSINAVDETDGYEASVRGVRIKAVRTGLGNGPNTVATTLGPELMVTAAALRFPIMTTTTIEDDVAVVARVLAAPPGSRWCAIDLEPGTMVLYGPGTEHAGVNPSGLRFAFASFRLETLAATSDRLEGPSMLPEKGVALALHPSAAAANLGSALGLIGDECFSGTPLDEGLEGEIAPLLTRALEGLHSADGTAIQKRATIDDAHVVRTCLGHAEAEGRVPTVQELCTATHVSERRLYLAFEAIYRVPPGRFFRHWGMDRSRRQLLSARPEEAHVGDVARGIGFGHLGRFAGRYLRAFGEHPSATLARSAGPAVGARAASPAAIGG